MYYQPWPSKGHDGDVEEAGQVEEEGEQADRQNVAHQDPARTTAGESTLKLCFFKIIVFVIIFIWFEIILSTYNKPPSSFHPSNILTPILGLSRHSFSSVLHGHASGNFEHIWNMLYNL